MTLPEISIAWADERVLWAGARSLTSAMHLKNYGVTPNTKRKQAPHNVYGSIQWPLAPLRIVGSGVAAVHALTSKAFEDVPSTIIVLVPMVSSMRRSLSTTRFK